MSNRIALLWAILIAAARGFQRRELEEQDPDDEHQPSPERLGSDSEACSPFVSSFDDRPIDVSSSNVILGEHGGEWSPCMHLKTYGLNFAPFFGRFLSYQLKPKSAMEFGCGLGTMSDFVARMSGTSVTCIEPEKTLGTLIASLRRDSRGNGRLSQLALNIFDNETDKRVASCTSEVAAAKHDLVYSLEVAEHIPARFHPALVEFLVASTKKWLVFSAARPEQGGAGHLNESMRTREKWREIFEKRGLIYMPNLTKMARRSAYPARSYDLYYNTLVFKQPGNDEPDVSQPNPMLRDFMYGGMDTARTMTQFPTHVEQTKAARAFNEGSNSALWPSLTLLEQQVKKGLACQPQEVMLSKVIPYAEPPAMQSAWASHFLRHP